jgi:hypothetical protein
MFRNIYEIFGLNPFFSSHMAQFLRGTGEICPEYSGTPLYDLFGFAMLGLSIFIYALLYHIIDKPQISGPKWCWIFAGSTFALNFVIAFIVLWTHLRDGVLRFECDEEFINVIFNFPSVAMFAFVNAVLGFIVFAVLSSSPYPRRFSKNLFNTTFWSH